MNVSTITPTQERIDGKLIDNLIDTFYGNMLDDYRINRFFCSRPLAEQTDALKNYVKAELGIAKVSNAELVDLLDTCFTKSFARTNAKPSLVTGNDFAFLLDVVGGQEIRTITPLCPAHNFLLKLDPSDENYDVVIEHVALALKQLNVNGQLQKQLLDFAEQGRDGVLGRGQERLIAA